MHGNYRMETAIIACLTELNFGGFFLRNVIRFIEPFLATLKPLTFWKGLINYFDSLVCCSHRYLIYTR
jgi:hypothetical protein